MPDAMRKGRLALLVSFLLLIGTFAAYFPVKDHAFIDFDDAEYIVENPHVATGLTLRNVEWAFTSAHSNNWHPLTWVSHMVDVELFGLNPAGHHLMNVLFHALNALLLFLALSSMTGMIGQSAFVAALFALHPLHVESVAWAAERKDVLSTLFWMLTLLLYARYAEKRDWKRYGAVLAVFSLGLMAKQMLVTLPFVLLLLDFWPLKRTSADRSHERSRPETKAGEKQRLGKGTITTGGEVRSVPTTLNAWIRLIAEKIPFFALAAAASVVVFLVQLSSGVLFNLNPFPLNVRIENAIVSYLTYLGKMLCPIHLAVFYPHPLNTLASWQIFGAAGLLVLITMGCLKYRQSRPYLCVGWFWYLGTLVPVIGLVQVGVQAMADRYTYIPLIGIFIMLAWGLPDVLKRLHSRKCILAALALLIIVPSFILTRAQVGTWKDRIALYSHAIEVIPQNYWAYNNLGAAVASAGNIDEAMGYFSKSLHIMPMYPGANKNMAVALIKKERYAEASPYLQKALQMQPRNPEYLVLTGLVLMKTGNNREAITYFQEALKVNPSDPNAREGLQEAYDQNKTR